MSPPSAYATFAERLKNGLAVLIYVDQQNAACPVGNVKIYSGRL